MFKYLDKETFNLKKCILLEWGNKETISHENELLLNRFDTILQDEFDECVWNDLWEKHFPTNEEKISLLKGLILFEKFLPSSKSSVAANILVFREIQRLGLDTPQLLDWIFKNRSDNDYTPFGWSGYSHFKNYEDYAKEYPNHSKKFKRNSPKGIKSIFLKLLLLLSFLFPKAPSAETLTCFFNKIDEGQEVVTFKKENNFYYATPLYHGNEFSGVGYKVIFNQDGFLTLARGVNETAEICVINKKENYFECRGLTLNNETSGRITGKCYDSNN